MSTIRRFTPGPEGDYRWEAVDLLRYKDDGGAPFRDVTRQVLFARADQSCELRYFEVAPNGHSTLERHEHTHAVLILRGRGTVQIGADLHPLAERDLVTIEPMTWHQFHAAADSALGFLCLVAAERDKPQIPSEHERAIVAAKRR